MCFNGTFSSKTITSKSSIRLWGASINDVAYNRDNMVYVGASIYHNYTIFTLLNATALAH